MHSSRRLEEAEEDPGADKGVGRSYRRQSISPAVMLGLCVKDIRF